jgi:transglutaminase-like putative cysteine protease
VIASEPESANIQLSRVLVGSSESEGDVVWFITGATDYTVTSWVPDLDPAGAGLTQWRLRHAGTTFDAELLKRYTQGADLLGADSRALLIEIEAWAGGHGYELDPKTGQFANEYDAADAIQAYMRDAGHFTYVSDVTDLITRCEGMTTADCFAKYRRGFCEQYATTMTMLMRLQGFPARYVEGYLAGHIDEQTRQEQITGQQRHAWVEVYFPTYGWIPFDPTGGSVGAPTELPAGQPVEPTPTPGPSASTSSDSSGRVPRLTPFEPGQPSGGATGGGVGGQLLVPGLIAGSVLLVLLFVLIRPRRRLEGADAVYRSVVSLASRLGYRPSPTQTVYEYTGMLAEIVPKARDPLGEVATAKVELVYGRREPTPDRLASLAQAKQVVRRALMRLAFNPPWRRRRPKRR